MREDDKRHNGGRGCAFCTELDRIFLRYPNGGPDETIAVDELFDRADRAARARRLYGKRKGHR